MFEAAKTVIRALDAHEVPKLGDIYLNTPWESTAICNGVHQGKTWVAFPLEEKTWYI